MFRALIILIILNFYNPAFSSSKEKIINKMKLTNNISFDFIQTIDNKKQKGSCIIKYPKKIFCEYDNIHKKILVSNGRSLVIKNRNSGNYYIYPIKKTPLNLLLDKNYLISKIKILESRVVNDKYINFQILEDKSKINIFFSKETFNLIGWQTEDIYQNLVITFISSIKFNKEIDENIFIHIKQN